MTWIQLSQTIDCINERTPPGKRSNRKQSAALSQSCHVSRETFDTTSTSEYSNQNDELSLERRKVSDASGSTQRPHKSADSTEKHNSICTTISAISNLGQECLSGRCLSCSLDGLRAFHPKCTVRTDSLVIRSIDTACAHESSGRTFGKNSVRNSLKNSPCATISSANLNMTSLSSMTLFSTWPGRSAVHNPCCHLHNGDYLLETASFDFSSEIEFLSEADAAKYTGNILSSEGIVKLVNSTTDTSDDNSLSCEADSEVCTNSIPSHVSSVTEVFCDDLCEDWDDGHENDNANEEDIVSNSIMNNLEAEVVDLDVEVYTASEKSSVKLHNEVMSACDWSFLQDDKIKTKKKCTKKKVAKAFSPIGERGSSESESGSVSSCSRSYYSDEDEEDDEGSIDKYLMNEIIKRKMNGNYQVHNLI